MPSIASAASLLTLLPALATAETVVGVYMFHRHGDRTPKYLPPVNLTTLGYEQVHDSGTYYRSRYLSPSSPLKVKGLNPDLAKLSQIAVTAPVDNVLQNSASAFLQGLYPPVGDKSVQILADGSSVQAPLDGYQLIPVNIVSSGTGSEDNTWLQDATGCANAKISSNSYFSSLEYQDTLSRTKQFYSNLYPVVNETFTQDQVTFKNGYIVYDVINVATIHNSTIHSAELLTDDNLLQLRSLAHAHEWGLAYNKSDDTRAISGMQLAGEILAYLNGTINSKGAAKMGIQFGAYATFFAFFGLADLPSANPDFMGIPDYSSSMVFELYTDANNVDGFPATDDLRVRFLFHNATASNSSPPTVYPLFGQKETSLSWKDFAAGMNKFAVHTTEDWCHKCGNTTGTCAAYAPPSNNGNGNGNGGATTQNAGGHKLSAAVGGVIGAMVTLAVVLGIEALAMLVGGLRLTRKRGVGNPVQETAQAKA